MPRRSDGTLHVEIQMIMLRKIDGLHEFLSFGSEDIRWRVGDAMLEMMIFEMNMRGRLRAWGKVTYIGRTFK